MACCEKWLADEPYEKMVNKFFKELLEEKTLTIQGDYQNYFNENPNVKAFIDKLGQGFRPKSINYFWAYLAELEVTGQINISLPSSSKFLPDEEASKYIGAKRAHSIWIDKHMLVPWRLRDYSDEELNTLLANEIWCGMCVNDYWQDIVDYSPSFAWNYAKNFIMPDKNNSVYAIIKDLRNFRHGAAGDVFPDPYTLEVALSMRVAASGCGCMGAISTALAKSINIPCSRTIGYWIRGHTSILFYGIGYMPHGDDFYNALVRNTPSSELICSWDYWKDYIEPAGNPEWPYPNPPYCNFWANKFYASREFEFISDYLLSPYNTNICGGRDIEAFIRDEATCLVNGVPTCTFSEAEINDYANRVRFICNGGAMLYISSLPLEATIYIDNVNIGKTNSSYQISPGTHTLKLNLSGYQDYTETFSISQGQTKTFNITLIPEGPPKTIINVNSTPTGANIYLDSSYIGKTNSSYEIQPGSHTLKLTLSGYQDYTETFSISQGYTINFNIALLPIPPTIINVDSTPTGANVYLDDVYLGNTPYSNKINPGSHNLRITLVNYQDYIQSFSINQGETKTFNVNLVPIPKTIINVNSTPTGADIYLDENYLGKTNSSYEIQPDIKIILKLTLSGYQDYTETFAINRGETKNFNITLIPIPKTIINVNSTPTGANIYLDSSYIGKTNSSYEIQPGSHTLKLTLSGYQDYTETFSISQGQTKTFNINLIFIPPPASDIRFYKVTYPVSDEATHKASIYSQIKNYSSITGTATVYLVNNVNGDILSSYEKTLKKNQSYSKTLYATMPYSINLPSRILKLKVELYENDVFKERKIFDINLQEGIGDFILAEYPTTAKYRASVKIYVTFANIGAYSEIIYFNIIDNDTNKVLASYSSTLSSGYSKRTYKSITMPNKKLNFRVEIGHKESSLYLVDDISQVYTINLI